MDWEPREMLNNFTLKGNLFLIILGLFSSCDAPTQPHLVIREHSIFPIPAVSGVEKESEKWIFIDDIHGRIYEIPAKTSFFKKERQQFSFRFKEYIAKGNDKIDFEAIALFQSKGKTGCLVLPSGTKWPNRNRGLLWNDIKKKSVKTIDITAFYEQLMDNAKLNPNQLNIEGLAVHQDELFLLNRGKNKLIKLSLTDFMEYIQLGKTNRIKMKVYSIDLPIIDGYEAGLSGAAYDDKSGWLYFSASVEKNQSHFTDGAIAGSFIGRADPKHLSKHIRPECHLLEENGKPIAVKVESLVILKGGEFPNLFLVSDGDGKPSHCFEVDWK